MDWILFWLVIGSSIWVGVDARSIGVRRGLTTGAFDMSPLGWALACFFLWIVSFPCYLAKRNDLKRLAMAGPTQGGGVLDPIERLRLLGELHRTEVLSDTEFQSAKERILLQMR